MGCSCSKAVVSMQVQDRETGALINETVPSYLRSVYRLMYQNPVGRRLIKFPVTTALLRRATARHGVKMDDPNSAKEIERFIETYGVNVSEVDAPLESFATFNDFFCRKLRAGVRPTAAPLDDNVLVSPADCRLLVYPSIEDTTKIWLKGQDFTIASLLGPKFKHYLHYFHNPAIAIARLAPQDYHRWHMPCSSTVGPREALDGTYFSVSPRAVREVNILCTNKREVCMFDSATYGKWCMISVGAAMVSSISIDDAMIEGSHAAKGAEHGLFRFGGSTLILLFDSHSIVWDKDLIESSRQPIETYVKVGTQIARSRKLAVSEAEDMLEKLSEGGISDAESAAEEEEKAQHALLSPTPVSPSLIHTATTDAGRKEAHLNDEGLLNDFPYTMQSNLTLVELEKDEGQTIRARNVPNSTTATDEAAEAVGADASARHSLSVADLIPSFLQPDQSQSSSVSPLVPSTNEPVPAPPVYQLFHFAGDDAGASSDEDEDDEEDVEMGEGHAEDDRMIDSPATSAPSSAEKKPSTRPRANKKRSSKASAAAATEVEEEEEQPKKKKKGSSKKF